MTTENPNADQHTPEPWTIDQGSGFIVPANGGGMVADAAGDDFTQQSANARRIVACVNACRGIPTDWLERQPDLMQCLVGWCLDFCAEHRGSLTDDEIRDGLADLLTESFGFDLSDPHVAPAWTDRREIRRAATD